MGGVSEGLEPTAESVLRLARVLARGEGEDVAQRAWVAALERRIPVAELRGWLQGAVRRLSRATRREDARREHRELRAARPEEVEGTLEALERLEAVQELVRAVRGLSEPYRTALILRFFGELQPREIAERTGVPVNTARSRVRRGIEDLRRRMPLGALLVLVPRREVAVPLAPWLVTGGALVGAAVVLVAALRASERGSTPEPAAVAPALAVDAADVRRTSPLEAPDSRQPLTRDDPRPQGVSAREEGADLVRIRGRLGDEGGAALAGVALQLDEYQVLRSGDPNLVPPDAWTRPFTESAADGRFELAFEAPEVFGFGLTIAPAGRAPQGWFWPRLAPGTVLELGDLAFAPEAGVSGRVLDLDGEPRLGDALTLVFEPSAELAPPRDRPVFQAAVDPELATFELTGLPAESGTLRLLAPSGRVLAEREHAPSAGRTEALDLLVAGPRTSELLTLEVRAPFGLLPEASALRVEDVPDAQVRRFGLRFELGPLPAGGHTLTLDDARFRPWRQEAVEPGTVLVAELVGRSALELLARAPDGSEVRAWELELEYLGSGAGATLFTPHRRRVSSSELVTGELSGLVPGDYRLSVRAGAWRAQAEVDALASDERRTLTLDLVAGAAVRGRCLRADGSPAAGLVLSLLAPGSPDGPAAPIVRRGWHAGARSARRELELVRTDVDGAFEFELPAAGRFLVALLDGHGRVLAEVPFQVTAGEALAGLELMLPPLDLPELFR